MGRQEYNNGLAKLRELRTAIGQADKEVAAAEKVVAAAEAARAKLGDQRARQVMQLASFEGAKADAIAKAGGMSVGDVVDIAPLLDPTPADRRTTAPAAQPQPAPAQSAPAPVTADAEPVPAAVAAEPEPAAEVKAFAPEHGTGTPEAEQATVAPVVAEQTPAAEEPPQVQELGFRELPSIPTGAAGADFTRLDPNLVSIRPNFDHTMRSMVFLDAATGEMTLKERVVRVDLGRRTPEEILDAVQAAAPGTERIYITAGDPWHTGAERYPTLIEAVAAWLNTPSQKWGVDAGRGKDAKAGHFAHERHPVGRYKRVNAGPKERGVEILSAGQWFDAKGADVALVRAAFLRMYNALRAQKGWEKVALLGFPSLTGMDLWRRTIPTRGRWAGGYPAPGLEVRELMHATAGQGRTELILPPRVPAQLSGLVELDRTFAYGKHTWKSGVGEPQRLTARGFAALSETEQDTALMAPSHWNIRVTVPAGWQHVGVLPAPVSGQRAWDYPATPGTRFTTWASGPEVHAALNNPVGRWGVEILDGLVWESGSPIKLWATKLKNAWSGLMAESQVHGDERVRRASYLAARAVRSILLYTIGAFAAGPTVNTGYTPRGEEVPDGAEILSEDQGGTTWKRLSHSASDPHPHWAAGVWGGARAALLTMTMHDKETEAETSVGALHMPPGTVVAFRTDAIYLDLAKDPGWPYQDAPGDYLLKGLLPGPLAAPTSEGELMALRKRGRDHLAAQRR
ncbi:hypothetical protein ACGF12_13840 [Kitasatospora sp. NPDC048296]|uniref:hypothetical protein n=1 Tax=Kitasatospora sp. NPDC048296 TaxID=3364048 RepID=UPI003712CED3